MSFSVRNKGLNVSFTFDVSDKGDSATLIVTTIGKVADNCFKAILDHLAESGFTVGGGPLLSDGHKEKFVLAFGGPRDADGIPLKKISEKELQNNLEDFLMHLNKAQMVGLNVAPTHHTGHEASHEEFFAANIKPQPKSNAREV